MAAPVGEFQLTRLERVISGPGKADSIGEELNRRGLSRALVVTGRTLSQSRLLERIEASLGSKLAGVFSGVKQHVPSASVRALAAEVESTRADVLISFGGGSPIDTAKAAIHHHLGSSGAALVHIAIPTTLSAGEFTPSAGVTDEEKRAKYGLNDPRLTPQTVIQDPLVTLETPAPLWTSTAMRALDHAVETVYSVRHHPLSDALASKAIALLVEHLMPSTRTGSPEQIDHRGYCQIASWLSIYGSPSTGFGLSHSFGHQIGPRWNVPHGVTSCITLPHVMRYMAHAAPERFAPIAEGYGIRFQPSNPRPAALEAADRTAEFIARFDVPARLRDAGVPQEEIADIVPLVAHEVEQMHVLEKIPTQDEILTILRAAY